MSINSDLPLSNCGSTKKGIIMPSLISSNCDMSSKCVDESLEEGSRFQQHYCITLGVGPLWWSDVPHAALSVSTVNTESRGVGIKQSQLSVSSHIVQEDELLKAVRNSESLRLTFTLHLTESTSVEWETVVWRHCLYIRVPSCLLPEGSKEGFVSLLEYAEETLQCTNIIICLRKDRADRAMLVRTFMFLGFTVLPPTHSLVPPGSDAGNLYMLYAIE
ncbi:LOW QUALITY PROTEIN: ornithine decarboxylase antizyme 1 [Bombus pascuorum]|uniref:LOW QUALITY PROTEIN: ornithine decarboxylase antizyme 1 n=1 Tax=Bombus pascuorum TaxID=65598 RepID=UPI00298DA2E0|nr:LOW QUALITY PROTEIN: ornithine decarboxylase antizyme 1 [Bombus pascuorum]